VRGEKKWDGVDEIKKNHHLTLAQWKRELRQCRGIKRGDGEKEKRKSTPAVQNLSVHQGLERGSEILGSIKKGYRKRNAKIIALKTGQETAYSRRKILNDHGW